MRSRPFGLVPGLALLLCVAGCGSDASPTLFGPTPSSPLDGALGGTVIEYGTNAPVPGATLIMSGQAAVADALGQFRFGAVPSIGAAGLTTDVNGFLFRGLALQLGPNRTGVTIDLVRNAAPFDLDFYRQFVRNSLESAVLFETRPWTVDPSFYVRTVTSDTGIAVPPEIIESMRISFAASIPELSGGRRRMASWETGAEARESADGWVNVIFFEQLANGSFGSSTVGGNSATMSLRYPIAVSNAATNPFNCSSPTLGVADHEITHTMGYWHTADVFADTFSGEGCPGAPRTERARYHATLMYSRPRGNRDPDIDPVDLIQVTAGAGAGQGPVVYCFRPR